MTTSDQRYLDYLAAKEKAAKTRLKVATLENQLEKARRDDAHAEREAHAAFLRWSDARAEETRDSEAVSP